MICGLSYLPSYLPGMFSFAKDDGAVQIRARSMTFPSTGFRVAIAMLARLDLRDLLPRARLPLLTSEGARTGAASKSSKFDAEEANFALGR